MQISRVRAEQAERTESVKALRQEKVSSIQRPSRSMWLERSEQEKCGKDKVGESTAGTR